MLMQDEEDLSETRLCYSVAFTIAGELHHLVESRTEH